MDSVRNAAPEIWSLNDLSVWPRLLQCEHCPAVLQFARDRAEAVGDERRIILPVSTPR